MNSVPEDFDWQIYLQKNIDLIKAGITTKQGAIWHFLNYGRFEDRVYSKLEPNQIYFQSSVFIAGTSQEIEVLNDKSLVNKIEEKFKVLTINSSFHFLYGFNFKSQKK
jgi:hypothetical protein